MDPLVAVRQSPHEGREHGDTAEDDNQGAVPRLGTVLESVTVSTLIL